MTRRGRISRQASAASRAAGVVVRAEPGQNLEPLFELLLHHIPAPMYEEGHPLQALVTNLDASPYVGRLAMCRVHHGTIRKGQQVAWCRRDGTTIHKGAVWTFTVPSYLAVDDFEGVIASGSDHDHVDGVRPDVDCGELHAVPRSRNWAQVTDSARESHVFARGA